MSTPRSATERASRKAISEKFLKEILGLNDPWIERWEENGTLREEPLVPDQLPEFIRQKLNEGEVKAVESKVDQLVAAGCHRPVVYFCLQQLSPAAEWSRSGGHLEGVHAQQGEELASQKQMRPIATREDMATVASKARAARKQIHGCKFELSLTAEASGSALPGGFSTSAENPEDALMLLEAALSWVAKLADAYTAPMETTLVKSKGLLYLTLYISRHADQRKLRSPRVNDVIKDRKKASGDVLARTVEAPGNVLAELASKVTGDDWPTSDLKEKLESFRLDHPRLYRLLDQKLTELHRFAGR